MTIRLAVWSGPRNISTALMRSWENRPDCEVVDEPLYAHYLWRTGLAHPGRDEVIAAGETDQDLVIADLTAGWPGGPAVQYQKHMAQHLLPGLPLGWISDLRNVLLIRNPDEVIASYLRSRAQVRAADIGIGRQLELYDLLGAGPPVIDAADFLRDPTGYLRWLCSYTGVEFLPAMLRWPPGPRESDGVWARYWYDTVLASTGFQPYRRRVVQLSGPARNVADELRPAYERLHAVRVRPHTVHS